MTREQSEQLERSADAEPAGTASIWDLGKGTVSIQDPEKELREDVRSLAEALGEQSIGVPWGEVDHTYWKKRPRHAACDLGAVRDERRCELAAKLTAWLRRPGPQRVLLLISLWRECWELWDAYLVYRTLQAVDLAAEQAVEDVMQAGAEPHEDWELRACHAVSQGINLILADADIFQQINLSSADGVAVTAAHAVEVAQAVLDDIKTALAATESEPGQPGADVSQVIKGLREVAADAQQNQIFYRVLVDAGRALGGFERWLVEAPRLGSRPSASRDGSIGGLPDSAADSRDVLASMDAAAAHSAVRRAVLVAIDDAIGYLRSVEKDLSAEILSRCEPWERLLTDTGEIVSASGSPGAMGQIFVPKQVSIRYCYPFAVQTDEPAPLGKPGEVGQVLEDTLLEIGIKVGVVQPLEPTPFFNTASSGLGFYGGLRVHLPDITLRYRLPADVDDPQQPRRCRVWVDLSLLGNHCLCIEPEPLKTPSPPMLDRALEAGTPFVLGAEAVLVGPSKDAELAWDNMHCFGRDVIRAIAKASFWHGKDDDPSSAMFRSIPGNLHEIVIVQTDSPLESTADEIAKVLDSVRGGRVLLRSVQRASTTLEEWVRYPPVPRGGGLGTGPAVIDMPELGFAGDWCAHTGETMVFGIVAIPSWHSDVYAEAAQFAISWSPALQMWHRRLQAVIQEANPDRNHRENGEKIRRIDQQVRQHLFQIQAEELCATLTHRQFLDQLLSMSGVGRLQDGLEVLLDAAERLTDWFSDQALRRSEEERRQSEQKQHDADRRRERLLAVIAVFGVFELGTFLALANQTQWHQRVFSFTLQQGIWEDWLMVALFLLAVIAAVGLFGGYSWLRDHLHGRHRGAPRSSRVHKG